MNQSVNGCVVDETKVKLLTSPDVKLYRIEVSGETCSIDTAALEDSVRCLRYLYLQLRNSDSSPSRAAPFPRSQAGTRPCEAHRSSLGPAFAPK